MRKLIPALSFRPDEAQRFRSSEVLSFQPGCALSFRPSEARGEIYVSFLKKLLIFLFLLLIFLMHPLQTFAQKVSSPAPQTVNLSGATPGWVSVMGGNAVSSPVRTSFGYIIPCEGRMLCAITNSGTLLWQKSFGLKLSPFVGTGIADVIYAVTKDSFLNMLNSSGKVLWKKDAGFTITEAPLAGRDGRVFVKGKKSLACYGIHGVRRWKLDLEEMDVKIPLSVLNDGSLLVFMEKKSAGKSIAKRITPFGEVNEEIIFAGKVERLASCKEGVLLSFSDGSAGLCSVKGNRAYSAWAIAQTATGFKGAPLIATNVFGKENSALMDSLGNKILLIKNADGSVYKTVSSPISGTSLKYFSSTVQGLVLADQESACCFLQNGDYNWQCSFDKKKKWKQVYATDSGYLAFCTSAWSVEAYRVKQNPGSSAKQSSFIPLTVGDYKSIYGTTGQVSSSLLGRAISEDMAEKMLAYFSNGDFGTREGEWLPLLDNEMALLYQGSSSSSWDYTSEKNFFQTDVSYKETVLHLASENGSLSYIKNISSLLKKTNDTSLLLVLVQNAGSIAFDPDGDLLSALSYVLQKKVDSKTPKLAQAVCDSVYEICRVMGKPAFSKGQQMLTYLLYPQFPSHIQTYARETLQKLGTDTSSQNTKR